MGQPQLQPPAFVPFTQSQAEPLSRSPTTPWFSRPDGENESLSSVPVPPLPSRENSFRSRPRELITSENFRAQVNEAVALNDALSEIKSRRRARNAHFAPSAASAADDADDAAAVSDDDASTATSADLDHVGRHFQPTGEAKDAEEPRSSVSSDGIRNSISTFDEGDDVVATATQVRARNLTLSRFRRIQTSPFEDVFSIEDSDSDLDSDQDDEEGDDDTKGFSTIALTDSNSVYQQTVDNPIGTSSDAAATNMGGAHDSVEKLSPRSSVSLETVGLSTPPTDSEV
ncbi:hypothetical protein KJ359_007672 [Pestalotiopsis sp. 9143b]|nr:hypothetical protein KJ359_007672 [Pestalotiopsis sp. 9143b]